MVGILGDSLGTLSVYSKWLSQSAELTCVRFKLTPQEGCDDAEERLDPTFDYEAAGSGSQQTTDFTKLA